MNTKRNAFTLVEALTVITIMAILMAIGVGALSFVWPNVRSAAVIVKSNQLEQALITFKSKHGVYPPSGFESKEVCAAWIQRLYPNNNEIWRDQPQNRIATNNIRRQFGRQFVCWFDVWWEFVGQHIGSGPNDALVFWMTARFDDQIRPLTSRACYFDDSGKYHGLPPAQWTGFESPLDDPNTPPRVKLFEIPFDSLQLTPSGKTAVWTMDNEYSPFRYISADQYRITDSAYTLEFRYATLTDFRMGRLKYKEPQPMFHNADSYQIQFAGHDQQFGIAGEGRLIDRTIIEETGKITERRVTLPRIVQFQDDLCNAGPVWVEYRFQLETTGTN